MAELYSEQYQEAFNDVPASKNEPGSVRGRLYNHHAKFSLSAVIAVNDEILMFKLPKGAKVKDVSFSSPSMGATGIFDVGIKDNGVESEDQNYFINQADAGGQAVLAKPAAGAAFIGQKLSEETTVFIKCTEVTVNSSGDLYLDISYTQE